MDGTSQFQVLAEPVNLRISWTDNDNLLFTWANQFIVQPAGANEILISLGQVHPPLVIGSAEEQQEQLRKLTTVDCKVVSRVSVSLESARQLLTVLQTTLDGLERIKTLASNPSEPRE